MYAASEKKLVVFPQKSIFTKKQLYNALVISKVEEGLINKYCETQSNT